MHLAETAERGLFDFFFLAEGCDCASTAAASTTSTCRAPGHLHRARGAGGRHRPARPGRHHQHHLQRTLRGGKAIRHPRPPVRRPGRLEHGDVVGCVHRENFRRGGYLARRPLHAGRGVRHRRPAVLGQLGCRRGGGRRRPPASTSNPIASTPSNTTARSSTCAASPRCPPARRAIRCCCRPVIRRTAGTSAPSTPTRCSPCTPNSPPGRSTTPTSRPAPPRTAGIRTGSRSFPPRHSCSATPRDRPPDRARHIRMQQVTGPTAIAMVEQVWQRDLSDYDPDGPLPDVEPVDDPTVTQGRVRHGDPKAIAAAWRERAEAGEAEHPRTGHRGDQPSAVRRHTGAGGRRDRPARAVGRLRRLHPGAAPDAARARRIRRPRWSRCCRNGEVSVPSTAGSRCASTSASRLDGRVLPRPGGAWCCRRRSWLVAVAGRRSDVRGRNRASGTWSAASAMPGPCGGPCGTPGQRRRAGVVRPGRQRRARRRGTRPDDPDACHPDGVRAVPDGDLLLGYELVT